MIEARDIITEKFKMTGALTIDVDKIVGMWSHLWWICEWRKEGPEGNFRLIKYVRRDSGVCEIKMTISEEQAKELIEKAGLTEIDEPMLRSSFGWKRQADIVKLEKWRMERVRKKLKRKEHAS